MKKSIIQREL